MIHSFVRIAFPLVSVLAVTFALSGAKAGPIEPLRLTLRARVETFKGSNLWDEVTVKKDLPARETAIIICDMWDNHWCNKAAERCGVLAKKMNPVLEAARAKGVRIIHAPSDCMDFYKDFPQRKRIPALAKIEPPKPIDLPDPPLPVETPTGGCDDATPTKSFKAWTRQHAAIAIHDDDLISDNGKEIYSFLASKGIKNVLMMGVHTNMCVLHRSFAIKQMTRWGIRCILVRDLTDAMYSPEDKPYVSHAEGTELIIQHIEKHWCPTVTSVELVR